jgi:peptidoglycan-associated lipoprotein
MLRFCRYLKTAMVLGLLQIACTPTYPKCDKDTDCPGNKDNREWCVNGMCQQCRPGGQDCKNGQECKAGRCEAIPGYCRQNSDCPTGRCVNNRCASCENDGQCNGGRCSNGNCVSETRKKCKGNDDCAESEDCIDGYCNPANRPSPDKLPKCDLSKVFFDFNESVLSAEATATIDRNAECIKKSGRGVTLVGRTDPRGTQEYNLALSERRAQSVKERLSRLGVTQQMATLPRGELDATGTDETGWSRDRNVEFQWR